MLHLDHAYKKINNKFTVNAENLDIAMPIYNLLEYSDNYFMTSRSLRNYYQDKMNDDPNKNNTDNYRIDNSKTVTSKSFEYKTKTTGCTAADNNTSDIEVVVALNYLRNFCRSLDLHLINCKIELDLTWSKDCMISEISRIAAVAANRPDPVRAATETT